MCVSATLSLNCPSKAFLLTKCSPLRYRLPIRPIFRATSAQITSAAPFGLSFPSLRRASISVAKQSRMDTSAVTASLRNSISLSAASASTTRSAWPSSTLPLKVLPSPVYARRQNKPVIPSEISAHFRTAFGSYPPLSMRSNVRKASMGRVSCSTTRAIETVLNLL